jgi:putative tryptophan/tyrosine transport system substrate-binding protein
MPISRRRLFATALAAPFIATPLFAQDRRPHRIFMMLFRGWEEACDGFRDYFRTREIPVELIIRDARQQRAGIEEMVREAKDIRPDLVYIWGTTTAVVALGPWDNPNPRQHITDLPVVFNIVTEPVANRIVRSLEQPGRNATGTLYIVPPETQMRTMAAYRSFRKIGAIFSPAESNSVLTLQGIKRVGEAAGFTVLERPARLDAQRAIEAESILEHVADLRREGVDWIYIPPDTALQEQRMVLTNAAIEAGLPTFAASERFVSFANGLTGLVCRYYNIGQFTGFKADQILRQGKRPEEIPVETLNRFSFLINMRTANTLRFFPPLRMLRYAETV